MRLLIALFLVCVSMVHGWDYKGDYKKDILKAVKKDNRGTCLKMEDGTWSPGIPTIAWEVNGRVIKEQYTTLDGRVYVVSFKYGGWKYEDTKVDEYLMRLGRLHQQKRIQQQKVILR